MVNAETWSRTKPSSAVRAPYLYSCLWHLLLQTAYNFVSSCLLAGIRSQKCVCKMWKHICSSDGLLMPIQDSSYCTSQSAFWLAHRETLAISSFLLAFSAYGRHLVHTWPLGDITFIQYFLSWFLILASIYILWQNDPLLGSWSLNTCLW